VRGLDLISQQRGDESRFYLQDGHSGVRLLTDELGAVTDTYEYGAYGEVLRATGTTENPYLYRGESWDAELGLQYLRARYYEPETGRFLSTDPFEGMVERPVSRHRYLYGNVNPVVFEDPSGESAVAANFNPGLISQIVGILQAIPQAQAIGVGGAIGGAILGAMGVSAGISALRGRRSGFHEWEGSIALLAQGDPTFLLLSIGLGITPFGYGNTNFGLAGFKSRVAGQEIEGHYLLGFGTIAAGFYSAATIDSASAFTPKTAPLPNPYDFDGALALGSLGVTLRVPWLNAQRSRGIGLGGFIFSMGKGFGISGGSDGFSIGYSAGAGVLIGWSKLIGSPILRRYTPTPESSD
jgi:RHS repeat-associated protein